MHLLLCPFIKHCAHDFGLVAIVRTGMRIKDLVRPFGYSCSHVGQVKRHGESVKPAKDIGVGDELSIRIGEYEWLITIKELPARRGPAAVANTLYDEGEESRARRMAQIADRKAQGSAAGARKGRPTKRERRQIVRFKGKSDD